jgi:integrating conjugative element protein (TIGR03757 family)
MRKSFIMALAILVSPAAHAEKLVVEAFYDENTRLLNTQQAERVAFVSVYDLSAPERLERQLSKGLPSDPDAAKQIANDRFKEGGNKLKFAFRDAYEGQMKAMSYNIEKVPAVVFNGGQAIIYGVADVNKAIAIYRKRGGQ